MGTHLGALFAQNKSGKRLRKLVVSSCFQKENGQRASFYRHAFVRGSTDDPAKEKTFRERKPGQAPHHLTPAQEDTEILTRVRRTPQ